MPDKDEARHKIRNSLQTIVGYAEDHVSYPESVRDFLTIIRKEVDVIDAELRRVGL